MKYFKFKVLSSLHSHDEDQAQTDLRLREVYSTTLLFHTPIITPNVLLVLLVCLFRDLFVKDLMRQRDGEKTEAQITITALENEVHNLGQGTIPN